MSQAMSLSSPVPIPPPLPPESILAAALNEYKKNTGNDLLSHPLSAELQRCNSVDGILAILQRQANTVEKHKAGNQRIMKWVGSSVTILCSISETLGDGAGLAFPPAKPIFTGIGILLAAAKDVSASHDVLLDLFGRMDDFFKRFKAYSGSFLNADLAAVLVKMVVKVLNILSIAMKEVEQSRAKRYIKRLARRKDIENALGELETLIQGEHYTVTAQVLRGVEAVSAAVQQMANREAEEEPKKIRADTRKWFSPPDSSTNHNIACNLYHADSATWLFDHGIFIDWLTTGSLLWVHGKPGSGKSIICSAIIQHIIAEAGQASIVYFYFDFRDKEKQNARNLVTSLLIQLSAFSDVCCDIIHRVYSSHGDGIRQPTNDVLKNCLQEMLTVVAEAAEHPIFIVMDALDECPDYPGMPTAREEVLTVLKDLVGLHHPNLRICVTSRPEVDIKSILNQLTIHSLSLHDESEQQKGIADYVRSIVNSDVKMREWPDEDKELVIKELSERADGMFRWVFCQLETLRRSVHRNLRGILEKLPKTLDETYERVLKGINEDNRDHARRLLHCLAVAIRPLRVEELAELLTFDFDGAIPKFRADWRRKDQEEAVLYTCSSLITVVDSRLDDFGKCRVVQFSHFSVKEFLISDRLASAARDVSRYHIRPGPAHTILAQTCLGFLLHLDIPTDWETGKRFPLARYAAEHWVVHARFEDVASHVKDGMQSLFDPDKHHLVAWLRIYNIEGGGLEPPSTPNPLYYAALCGFHDLVERLVISHPQLINTVGGYYDFPVLAALSRKYIQVAEFLLQHGGKVDIRGEQGLTLLQMSMDWERFQREDIAEMMSFLLRHGADANVRSSDLSTPLHDAVMFVDFKLAQLLLESGADVDSRDNNGRTPLHVVVTYLEDNAQALDITRLLLERGANVNAQDNNGTTPLLLAVREQFVDISSMLLEHGAEPNMKNRDGESSLHRLLAPWLAPPYDDDDFDLCTLARLLLGHGANVNDRDKHHTAPLHRAIKLRSYGVTQILLEHNAQPNVVNKDGKAPLHLVLEHKSCYNNMDDAAEVLTASFVRLLLERGAEVNAQDKDNITPLLLAVNLKMYDITRILLACGAEPNVKNLNDGGKTPLHLLLESDLSNDDDIPDLVRLLLDRGADVNAQDQNLATPLLLAAERHMDVIARILLERGADPNVKNIRGKTPLQLLLQGRFSGHYADNFLVVVSLLLECGADLNTQNEDITTPLQLAHRQRIFEIAQLILDRANAEKDRYHAQSYMTLEDVNAQNTDLINHLHWACYFGMLELTRELLGHGARANAENIRGETPLHLVSRGQFDGQEGVCVVQLLLGRDANVNAQDKGQITPLHLASYYGRLDIVRALLSHGARANTKGELGQTALHLVLDGNRSGRDAVGIVRLLLENGADVNAQDSNNETPLHLACNHGKFTIGRVLIIHGANANAANIRGQTPLHMLSLWPWGAEDGLRLVGILVDSGADINARDKDHETPLHTAIRNNRLDIVERLIKKFADTGAKNNKGETPIQVAPQSMNGEELSRIKKRYYWRNL